VRVPRRIVVLVVNREKEGVLALPRKAEGFNPEDGGFAHGEKIEANRPAGNLRAPPVCKPCFFAYTEDEAAMNNIIVGSAAVQALYARLRAFVPGGSQAPELMEALEETIVLDETTFDEAAQLSRTLEEFSDLVRSGTDAGWAGFRSRLPGDPQAPKPSQAGEIADLLASPELVARFSQESLETLEVIERCLLAMEKTRDTGDLLQGVFRSVHTLKGNAGFFGFQALEAQCMAMEAELDEVRRGTRALDAAAIESLLAAFDRLKGLVQAQAAPASSVPSAAEGAGFDRYTLKKQDIRVDTEKLETLFDLVGELITAEAMVIDHPEVRDLELGGFSRAAAALSKITRELQAVTMSIRMVPVEGLFGKMHRLVRDLGRRFGKEVVLEISGGDTEMDRNIIEEISDPLVHLIRNAVDHGIEDASVRRAKGKPGGRIRLSARYEGNEIWITVADDGAGLDRARILEVARSKGLAGDEELSDPAVWELIFLPGFSTAREVSEISGRGVGMDVVKKNLEKLRGQIEIRSVKDEGTEFLLKIPLTLAIIDGVTLRSGTTLYSIPIADVVEFQNYKPEHVTQTDPKHAVLRLRGEVLPVLPLAEVFVSAAPAPGNPGKRVAIIVKNQTRKLALVVDEIVGYRQIVLKALPESMAGLQGLSGCAVLGNGEVSLIIDVHAVFQRYLA
jgi:two-component system chemotaxis sensor kinase CheA